MNPDAYMITVRNATQDDISRVVGLWEELMDFHVVRDGRFARAADGAERFRDYVTERLSDEASRLLVAEADGVVAGYCLVAVCRFPPVFAERDYVAVYDLAVTAALRRKGVGERLFQSARDWCAERGMKRIEVGIALSNPVSSGFWRKMGFDPYLAKASLDLPDRIAES